MTVTDDRSPAFWQPVFNHPAVKPHVSLGHEIDLAHLLAADEVTALRAEHGGFIFVRMDGLGWVHELHTLFTPEGWGREVLIAAKAAFDTMFARGAQVILTYEVEGNWRSQPPRSFRFRQAADFAPALGARLRAWVLTRADWEASPARQRMSRCP